MSEDELIKQLNRGYVCPPDAGPAWRAAHDAGNDMSLLEHALELTPEQRLAEHQQVIDFLISVNPSILENGSE
jgi:hypothetical protein